MKRSTMSASVLALAFVLAGCGERTENTATEGAAADSGAVADKGAAATLERGRGAGTVTAIDAANGSITLDHGAIPDLKWPAMEMSFAAKPEQLAGLQVGDKVDFELDWDGKSGSVTSIRKAQ